MEALSAKNEEERSVAVAENLCTCLNQSVRGKYSESTEKMCGAKKDAFDIALAENKKLASAITRGEMKNELSGVSDAIAKKLPSHLQKYLPLEQRRKQVSCNFRLQLR